MQEQLQEQKAKSASLEQDLEKLKSKSVSVEQKAKEQAVEFAALQHECQLQFKKDGPLQVFSYLRVRFLTFHNDTSHPKVITVVILIR